MAFLKRGMVVSEKRQNDKINLWVFPYMTQPLYNIEVYPDT